MNMNNNIKSLKDTTNKICLLIDKKQTLEELTTELSNKETLQNITNNLFKFELEHTNKQHVSNSANLDFDNKENIPTIANKSNSTSLSDSKSLLNKCWSKNYTSPILSKSNGVDLSVNSQNQNYLFKKKTQKCNSNYSSQFASNYNSPSPLKKTQQNSQFLSSSKIIKK